MVEKPYDLLRKSAFFSDLDDETFDLIATHAVSRHYEIDQIVVWEDEFLDGTYIVVSGWLKGIKTTQTGREQVLRTFSKGDSFGLITSLAHIPNHIRIITLEQSILQKIPLSVMLGLIDKDPKISRQLIGYLSRNLSDMIGLVEDLSLKPVESRLAKFILNQADGDIYSRKKWETQDMIAARIGTVPDVLSRTLRNFEDEQIIQFDRHTITILDRPALARKINS